jgi:Fibronectin type III domain
MVLSALPTLVAQAIPAFPGAEGPGAIATGGRGGDVYHVTRLDADLAGALSGSLQYGINNAPGAGRTIVFDVGGTIYLAGQTAGDTFRYGDGNITVAGQTAPGAGITIAGTGTKWTGTNVILRNITIRPNKAPVTYDAFSLQVKNSILDHVSATWYSDEGISISDAGETTTVQYSNISEGLNYEGHAFGSIITTEIDGTKYSFNHNLYAHNASRMPRIGAEIGVTGAVLDFTNNVLYNWSTTKVGYGGLNQPCSTNFIGNYYLNGPSSNVTNLFVGDDEPENSGVTKVHQTGNKLDSNRNGSIDGFAINSGSGGSTYFRGGLTFYNQAFVIPNVGTRDTADVALQRTLDYGGANWQNRNPIDGRIMNSPRTGTGAGITDLTGSPQASEWATVLAQRPTNGVAPFTRPAGFDSDNDGMPNTWETAHGLSTSSASNNADFDNDGYRNIEEYINDLGAWPASSTLVFTNTNANGRYAEIGNWGNVWQPSRFDAAQINTGTVTVDAPGQQARALSIAQNSGNTAALSITSGWLEARQTVAVGPGGSGSVTHSGGVFRAGTSLTLGGATGTGNYTLSGGTLATPLLTKGTQGGTFAFTGGTLHAGTVAFALTNAGGKLAPGSDLTLQQMAAASMPDINKAVVAASPLIGTTRVMGNLILQSGSLEIDVASAASADKLTIDSALTLGGALTVVPASGYTPANGTRWLIATATGMTGSFTGVTTGYSIEIENGNSLYLVATSTGGNPSPDAPTGLTATASGTQIALSWTAVSGATSYNVRRAATSGGSYTVIASPATTGHADTGLTAGTTYYYVVSAVNGNGESANSTEASATISGGGTGTIAVVDSPAAIVSGSGTTITTPVTVTSGANCLVVLIGNMKETDHTAVPAVTWNGQSLTNAVMIGSGSTGAKSCVFYLYNPVTDGAAHDLSCTFTAGSTGWRFRYFTLSGVDTNVAPLPGSVTGGTTSISCTVDNCPANGLAAINAIYSNNASPVTLPAYGSGNLNALYVTDSNPTCALAYSSSIAAGTATFSATTTTASSKFALTAAVFTPASAAPVLPELTLEATDASAGEYGVDQGLSFTVTRTGATTAALGVPLTATGGATAGTDYSGFSSTATIPIGQSSVVVPLTVLPDSLAEGVETVTLSLGVSGNFTAGDPALANASIDDKPSQDYYFSQITDPAKRGPLDDADSDTNANVVEYFMGSDPGDGGSSGTLAIPSTGAGTFKVRYPRAKNHPDVSGSLRWSADLGNWFASGQSDGTRTVTFAEAVVSAPEADPETVEATATVTGAGQEKIFVRLGVQ